MPVAPSTLTAVSEIYRERSATYASQLEKLQAKRRSLGWLRLLAGVAIVALVYTLFFNAVALVWLAAGGAIALFLYLVALDADNSTAIAAAERLLKINTEELQVLQGRYYDRENGLNFLPATHPFAADIDLFGHASLYQYISRCTSEQSKNLLATLLLQPAALEDILQRQEAARSLAGEIDWRQNFQSAGMAKPLTAATERKILLWLNMGTPFHQQFWKYVPAVFTFISLACTVAYFADWLSSPLYTLFVLVFFLFAKFTSARSMTAYMALSRIEGEVNTIQEQLKLVETMPANTLLLSSSTGASSSQSIKTLQEILKRFDFRLNVFVFLFLNTFLLWDLRQVLSLNKWKAKNKVLVPEWFKTLANAEVINTLATLTFNHPAWVFPEITDAHFTLSAVELGHPLIAADKRVTNSFATIGTGKVSIITGSNMAGKSTFLRSIGVNLVLAQLGSPVCAEAFTFSPVHLLSSMRIADNLAENTSTFYAELKKLKEIIEQVKQHRKVFILLDEILRGTNSLDRHTGSEALVKQLVKEHAVAVIATHDVELAALENEDSNAIANYHFDVQVAGEELFFDYKLKRGICRSMNASLLMKKIGIEM